jgi:hypothetical protein
MSPNKKTSNMVVESVPERGQMTDRMNKLSQPKKTYLMKTMEK